MTVGVALVGLILTSIRGLRQDLARVESRLAAWMSALQSQMDTRIGELRARMDTRIGELRERMAHLEGLLEGLREAIAGRVAG